MRTEITTLGEQPLDRVVDDCVVIEIKSTHELQRNAARQLFNYLRATNLTAGMLLHFGPEPRFFRVSRAWLAIEVRFRIGRQASRTEGSTA
jgi:GxxExxY protein